MRHRRNKVGARAIVQGRQLQNREIARIWTIDRSEAIDRIYYLERGELVLKPEHYDVAGWPPGEAEQYTPLLADCLERGGWGYGFFDGEQLVGGAVLDGKFIGGAKDQLQLKFLHVSRTYRGLGLGRRLFELARSEARRRGAKRLYVSATPSEHTIDFYRSLGCVVTDEVDAELFALEPEDIHLEGPVCGSANRT